jgi:hypothetical protein
MNRRKNPAKTQFLQKFPETTIETESSKLNNRLRFSFAYFDYAQEPAQNFEDWSREQLARLLHKLQHYSVEPKEYWMNQRVGAGSLKVLEIYGSFPKKSDFTHPKHVPIDVNWARFRLESDMRLIGFLIPPNTDGIAMAAVNTFFIVFLDQSHRFYLSEPG